MEDLDKSLNSLLQLQLDDETQQAIVNIISALTRTKTTQVSSLLARNSQDVRREEPGVDWNSLVPPAAAAASGSHTPRTPRIRPPTLLKRTPSNRSALSSSSSDKQHKDEQQQLEETCRELDSTIESAYALYREYRSNLVMAFLKFEQFIETYRPSETKELSDKWRGFIATQRLGLRAFDKAVQQAKRRDENSEAGQEEEEEEEEEDEQSSRETKSMCRGLMKAVKLTESETRDEIERRRAVEAKRRQEHIAEQMSELDHWLKEVRYWKRVEEETTKKRHEVREKFQEFMKARNNGRLFTNWDDSSVIVDDVSKPI